MNADGTMLLGRSESAEEASEESTPQRAQPPAHASAHAAAFVFLVCAFVFLGRQVQMVYGSTRSTSPRKGERLHDEQHAGNETSVQKCASAKSKEVELKIADAEAAASEPVADETLDPLPPADADDEEMAIEKKKKKTKAKKYKQVDMDN